MQYCIYLENAKSRRVTAPHRLRVPMSIGRTNLWIHLIDLIDSAWKIVRFPLVRKRWYTTVSQQSNNDDQQSFENSCVFLVLSLFMSWEYFDPTTVFVNIVPFQHLWVNGRFPCLRSAFYEIDDCRLPRKSAFSLIRRTIANGRIAWKRTVNFQRFSLLDSTIDKMAPGQHWCWNLSYYMF